MWVNRKEYEIMKSMAENNKHDADSFRRIMFSLREKTIIRNSDFIIMKPETFDKIYERFHLAESKFKDVEAELELYKVKYHEMKTSKTK